MKAIANADILAVIGVNTDSGTVKLTLSTSANPSDVNFALDQILQEFAGWVEEIKEDYPKSYADLQQKLASAAEENILQLAEEGEAPHESQPPEMLAEEGDTESAATLDSLWEETVSEADNRPE